MKNGIGDVKAVKVSQSGIAIMECKTRRQMDKALKIKLFDTRCVTSFSMKRQPTVQGVTRGVSFLVEPDIFLKMVGIGATQCLKSRGDGQEHDSKAVLLEFEKELSDRIFIDYVCEGVWTFKGLPNIATGVRGTAMLQPFERMNVNVEGVGKKDIQRRTVI